MKGATEASPDRQRLVESLWEDARREAEGTLAHSRAEADRLLQEARAAAIATRAKALDEVRENADPLVARILNRGTEASRRRLLLAWQGFLDECFDEALSRLAAREAGSASLRPLLTEALRDLPPSVKVRIEVASRDVREAEAIAKELGVRSDVSASADIQGGVVVKLDGGREIRDNSLATRIDVLRRNPPLELFERLGGGSVDG